ncbi:FG-GAP-like repeat-containing protein [Amycolatopsis cihanbeyliensis]|uniref:VCBS repeat protein n=1 Tax=Amycolatopsis cihanbeyliensis TaxID=1128664 RepID=A0A542DR68_AMYCI|nr:FG-GAP-like repeat-containing protein [Amycolatopsis cihanbeyliensis]TQJ05465.1 VCBS repeat protein [Amycolatopsis cihanbeyliensis]
MSYFSQLTVGMMVAMALAGPPAAAAGPAPSTGTEAVLEVDTKDELLAALATATAGDTVFVTGTASIDLTGHKRVAIPAGVTLASDRGQDGAPGALLYNTELDLGQREAWAQFSPRGSGVRITGLRLRGPDPEIRDNAYQYDNSRGIEAINASDLTVDNNELSAWSHGAVYLGDTLEARVRDNDIHHNRRTGLGYGVVLYNNSSALIEFNTFTQNRHAIAGNGYRTQRYEARYNLVVDNARSHGFDMHGENETSGSGAPWAGDVIHINHNSFRSSRQPAVAVRGRPYTGARVSANCFAHGSAGSAVLQRHFTGNLTVGSNTYGTTTGTCHRLGNRTPVGWRLSDAGTGSWQSLRHYTFDVSEVGFGDFDGDGRTDVLRATGDRWYYSPGGREPFVRGAVSGLTRSGMRFGDFDGDGRTDVFSVSNGQWRFSSGATSSWQPLNTSGVPLADLRFGDFDGDGRTDVFRANGTRWYYSSAGTSSWQPLASSNRRVDSLGFGDFDGDGRTDVFALVGDRWRYSSGGAASWEPLAASTIPVSALRFGDLDGDGRTDVFRSSGGRWYYSSGGRSSWAPLAASGCPLSSLVLADLTGDGRDDVFTGRCG